MLSINLESDIKDSFVACRLEAGGFFAGTKGLGAKIYWPNYRKILLWLNEW